MGLSMTQARAHAPAMAYYLAQVDPKIHQGTVIDVLTKAPAADPLSLVTAAWIVIWRMREGEKIPFSHVGQQVVELELTGPPKQAPALAPVAEFKPVSTSWSHQPVNPRLEAECATHPGGLASNCAGCRADQLAGAPAYYQDLDQKEAA